MQTWLPYVSVLQSIRCLDRQRLNAQRREAYTIGRKCGFTQFFKQNELDCGKHLQFVQRFRAFAQPNMWRNSPNGLIYYYNMALSEWERRGYRNILLQPIAADFDVNRDMPSWWYKDEIVAVLNDTHRARLLGRNPEHYSTFNWYVTPEPKETDWMFFPIDR